MLDEAETASGSVERSSAQAQMPGPPRSLIGELRGWWWDVRGEVPEPSPEEKGEADDALCKNRMVVARDVGSPVGLKMAEAWLEEARSIYDHREARLARVEARATTLQGTVSVAVPLTLAAAALILDPNKVTDAGWRAAMAVLALVLVAALVLTGWYAARAALKRQERGGPQDMQGRLKAERETPVEVPSDRTERDQFEQDRMAHHLRERVVNLLMAADLNKEIDRTRTSLLIQARAWFYLSLAILVAFAILLSAYAVVDLLR